MITVSKKAPSLMFDKALTIALRWSIYLKVVSTTFVLVYFLSLIESTCQTRKNVFLFDFKTSFRSRENQILEFYIFKFHDVIKCPSIKQEIHFTE